MCLDKRTHLLEDVGVRAFHSCRTLAVQDSRRLVSARVLHTFGSMREGFRWWWRRRRSSELNSTMVVQEVNHYTIVEFNSPLSLSLPRPAAASRLSNVHPITTVRPPSGALSLLSPTLSTPYTHRGRYNCRRVFFVPGPHHARRCNSEENGPYLIVGTRSWGLPVGCKTSCIDWMTFIVLMPLRLGIFCDRYSSPELMARASSAVCLYI